MILQEETTFYLEGGKTVSLSPTSFDTGGNFVAKGGEAHIYREGNKIFKLYYKAGKEQLPYPIPEDKMEKLKLLRFFNSPYIISPKGFLYQSPTDKKPIGFWMYYAEGEPLARLFTNRGKEKFGLNDQLLCVLVERMRETVALAHAYRCIMVDHNELNWVVYMGEHGPEPRIMDVDSWMTRHWPAKAVHPLIEDYSSKRNFDQASDWFSWAIITFQLFIGIHPYKGTLPGYESNEILRRMKDHASVFSKGIQLPPTVKEFSTIPKELLDWYKLVFQEGYRGEPPQLQVQAGRIDILPSRNGKMLPTITPVAQKGLLRRVAEVFFEINDEPVVTTKKKSWSRKFAEIFVEFHEEPADTSPLQPTAIKDLPLQTPTSDPTTSTDYTTIFTQELGQEDASTTGTTPDVLEPPLAITEAVELKSERFIYACLYHHKKETAKKVFSSGIILTQNNHLYCLECNQFLAGTYTDYCKVRSYKQGWLIIDQVMGKWQFLYCDRQNNITPIACEFGLEQITWFEQRLFTIASNFIAEIIFDEEKLLLSLNRDSVYSFKPGTITWYQGVGIRRTPKQAFLVCITRNGVREKRTDELVSLTVHNAVSGENFVAVYGVDEHGRNVKREFTFTDGYQSYSSWKEYNTMDTVIFDRGTVVSLERDNLLEIYVPSSGTVRLVQDEHLKKGVPLFVFREKLTTIIDGRVYSVTMKDNPRAG